MLKQANQKEKTPIQAGIAGAGSGTFLVLAAKNISNPALKEIVVLASPTIAIICGVISQWCINWVKTYLFQREANGLYMLLRDSYEKVRSNPDYTDAEKEELKKEFLQIEKNNITELARRFNSLLDSGR